MNLKTSLFNKSIIKSDFKRFWWVSALYTLAIFVTFTFVYLNEISLGIQKSADTIYGIYTDGMGALALVCIVPVVLAAMLFSYLNSSGAVSCLHGLPIKRKTFYASHMLSGYVLLIIPVVINVLILLLFRLDSAVAQSYKPFYLFLWAGHCLIYLFMIFNAASAVAMLVGNSIATIVFTYIFGFLPMLAEAFIKFFCNEQLYGYSMSSNNIITDFLYHIPGVLYEKPLYAAEYIIFGIIFLAIAYFLYAKRNLENNGEVIAFPGLRPVFVYGVAVCAGAVGYAYFVSIWDNASIMMLVPFGVVGVVIAEMVVKKSLRVKSAVKPALIFCIAVCIIRLGFYMDIFGYEKKIPAIETIESVDFDNGVNRYYVRYTARGDRVFMDEEEYEIKSEQVINDVVKLHEHMIKSRPETADNSCVFTVTYKLKNGKSIQRCYRADYLRDKEYLEPIITSPEMREIYFPILKDRAVDVTSLTLHDARKGDVINYYADDTEQIEKVLSALKNDVKNTAYDEYAARNDALTFIEISYTGQGKFKDGTPVPNGQMPVINENYYVRSDYKNTIALLEEIGFYDMLPKAEDVLTIGVDYYNSDGEDIVVNTNSDYDKLIENVDEIKEVYEYATEHYSESYSYKDSANLDFSMKNGQDFSLSIDMKREDVPEILKIK